MIQYDGDTAKRQFRVVPLENASRRNHNSGNTAKDLPSMDAQNSSSSSQTATGSSHALNVGKSHQPMGRTAIPHKIIFDTWSLILSKIRRPKVRIRQRENVAAFLLWIVVVLTHKAITIATAFSVQKHNHHGHTRRLSRTLSDSKIPVTNHFIQKMNHYNYHRQSILPSRWLSILQASPGETTVFSFDEGDVGISRHNSNSNTQSFFSLYYRIYNNNGNGTPSAKQTSLVVLHGGP